MSDTDGIGPNRKKTLTRPTPRADPAVPRRIVRKSDLPPTRPIDRTRLEEKVALGPGSQLTALFLLRKVPTDRAKEIASLSVPIHGALLDAIESASVDDTVRLEANRAIDILSKRPNGRHLAAAILLARNPGTLRDDEVKAFAKARCEPQQIVNQLVRLARRTEANYALIGLQQPLAGSLRDALLTHPDAVEAQLAIEKMIQLYQARSEASIAALLDGVPQEDWVGCLAHRMAVEAHVPQSVEATFDVPERAALYLERLGTMIDRQLGSNSLPTRRGAIGEILRVMDLESKPELAGKTIVRGVQVMKAPLSLRACTKPKEALEWAAHNGREGNEVACYQTPAGRRFAIRVSEIDIAIIDGQTLERIESVKSGVGWGRFARGQNRATAENLHDPDLIFLCPSQHGYVDRTAELKVSPNLGFITVGPLGAGGYDEALPLSPRDIATIAEQL